MSEKYDRYRGAAVPKAKRLAIYTRDGHRCVYCDVDVQKLGVGRATLDHLIPNRDSSQKNLVTACFSCNQQKKNVDYRDFLRWKYDSIKANTIVEKIHDLISRGIDVDSARKVLSGRRRRAS